MLIFLLYLVDYVAVVSQKHLFCRIVWMKLAISQMWKELSMYATMKQKIQMNKQRYNKKWILKYINMSLFNLKFSHFAPLVNLKSLW